MQDLRIITAWLTREAYVAMRWLHEPQLWAVLALGLLLWTLAYQVSPSQVLFIGGNTLTHKRDYDRPYLEGVNASEPEIEEWWRHDASNNLYGPYRWFEDQATVTFPGIGGEHWLLMVDARSGRPDQSTVESTWDIGLAQPQVITVGPERRRYMLLGRTLAGDLQLSLQTPRLYAPADPGRNLGLVVQRVKVAPLNSRPVAPASRLLLLLAVCLICGYGLLRRLFLDPRWAIMLVSAGSALCALLLLTNRLGFAIGLPRWTLLVLVLYPIAVLLAPLLTVVSRATGISASLAEQHHALATTIAAFGLRAAGMLHPYAKPNDLGLNVHNLIQVIGGDLLFTEKLTCEAGLGRQPYPPSQYVLLAPLRLLTQSWLTNHQLIQLGNALLESCAAGLIWLLLRRVGAGRRAALLGASMYIVAPPLLASYRIGEFANLFAQSLLLPLLLFLVLGAPRADRRHIAFLGGLLLLLALLSHTGFVISTVALLLAWLSLWWRTLPARTFRSLATTGAVSVLIATAIYYSYYTDLISQRRALAAEQLTKPLDQRCPPGHPLGSKLQWEISRAFGGEFSPLLTLTGALGAVWVCSRRRDHLQVLLLACWIGLLLSFGTLLTSDQAVRWPHFLFPALCLGGGPLLADWMRRGRAGSAFAILLLVYLSWLGIAVWARELISYGYWS